MQGSQVKRRVVDPVTEFLRTEQGGGFALLLGAVAALLWVNLGGIGGYESFWTTELRIGIGDASITEDLRHWVNDGLMALFFFVISLEIKRELVTGDLRDPKAAALPIVAALGGVVMPVLIFLLLVGGGEGASGWGIPMATDAAFAIGVLVLLGDRVGVGVKLLLVTIAVVDDVAAICVIAVAYTDDLLLGWLGIAALGLVAIALMRRLGIVRVLAYVPVGLFVWVAMLESGVHATLAGVAVALLTPGRPIEGRSVLEELEERVHPGPAFSSFRYSRSPMLGLNSAARRSPIPWVEMWRSPSSSDSWSGSSSASREPRSRPCGWDSASSRAGLIEGAFSGQQRSLESASRSRCS
ncbi:MAG TPA: Na+/H+ antiporter NhaA [Tepidiformaceae bacterium]|nr:Na+/H+ antiporter NhaA [Tepidiformaceae bacterium]